MMSKERAEAFQELAKAVYDYMIADFYSRCDRDRELGLSYKNLMEIVEKEDNDQSAVREVTPEVGTTGYVNIQNVEKGTAVLHD
jgi:hypothetical protein